MGSARVAFVLLPLEERNFAEVGTFQPSLGFKDFSSGSPVASPHQWSPETVTTSLMVGRSKPGCGLCPALSFKDLHHPCWGGGRGEPGPAFTWAGISLLPPASRGGNHPPALWRRHPPAMPGRRTAAAQPGCSILSSVRATVASRTGGSHNTSYAARADSCSGTVPFSFLWRGRE
jgi:hypothetical protein